MFDPYKNHFYLPHSNPNPNPNHDRHHAHHRQHRTAGRRAVAPPPPPPQRVQSPNCCSSSAATSSVVSEPISLDLATDQYYVKGKENWGGDGARARRVPPRPLRRTAAAEHDGQHIVIPLDRFRTKNYSQIHANNNALDSSDDEDDDEDNFDQRHLDRFDYWQHARRYSTSDLTTSDSELGRFIGGNGKPYRLGIKCPSVSTINPDDSSLSFEDLDQHQMLCQPIVLGAPPPSITVVARRYNHHQNQRVFSTGARFYAFDDDVDAENCGAKSDAELTDRASSNRYHHHRSGNSHRRIIQRRMNAAAADADDDVIPPPPSRGTQSAPRTPQRHAAPPAMEMIKEISPILPRPADVRDDLDIPPLPRPLKLSKEWRPLQTSTLTNFHATLPKTNPRHSSAVTTKMPPIAPLEPPRSLFDPQYKATMCCGTMSSSDEFKPIRSEQFNLPSVMAKAKGIRGILFLQLCVTGNSVLKVQIRNGAYFLKSLPITSFVKVEIRRSISNRRRDKYASHQHRNEKRLQRFCSDVTVPVSQNNQPEFYEEFMFRVTRTHLEHGDKLGISVFVQQSGEEKTPELLGGMSFSLVKMMKMAQLHTTSNNNNNNNNDHRFFPYDHHQSYLPMNDVSVKLYEGGFFLLPDKKALTTKFAQDKISIRKYYDDIGGCSTTMSTTASSSMGSPFRMMSEPEWTAAAAHFGIGGVAPPNFINGATGGAPAQRRLFSPSRKASTGGGGMTKMQQNYQHHHHHYHNHHHQSAAMLAALAPPASAATVAASSAGAVGGGGGADSSAADTSHYTTSNSSSSGAQSAVDCKRTRGSGTVAATVCGPTVLDLAQASSGTVVAAVDDALHAPPAVPPPSVNTTDTTTSDFTTSSGFTSSTGGCGTTEMMLIGQPHHSASSDAALTLPPPHGGGGGVMMPARSLTNSISSGGAEVGAYDDGTTVRAAEHRGGSISGASSSSADESSSSSSSSPVVIELATNIVGEQEAAADGGQFRKASLQHHYSPMRMHRGGGGAGVAGSRSSPQKVAPPSSPSKQHELREQYIKQPQLSSPSKRSKGTGGGAGGRLRTALSATTDNTVVRRVASFTFSPPRHGSLQHNQILLQQQQQHFLSVLHKQNSGSNTTLMRLDKRNSLATGGGGGTDKMQRRMALGPFSKTLHFLRTKLDFSMSTSVLCPSREDCRLWQESFDALLAHKYGCLLFREFLQSEFSDENLDFWLECEQFKRMKPGKKSTVAKAHQIFDTFVKELALKEINLDSQTRLATQAALSVVPLRIDMYMLAQQKIAQLMAKDSYPRFLKSEQYLELLNNNNHEVAAADQQQQQLLLGGGEQPLKGLLRVASARNTATTKSSSSLSASSGGGACSRSPSLSPRSGTRWHTRQNTCAPTPTATATTTQMPTAANQATKVLGTVLVNNGTMSGTVNGIGTTPLTLQIPSSIAE